MVLDAAEKLLYEAGMCLSDLLRETRHQSEWIPWRGLPVLHPKCPKAGTIKMVCENERYLSTGREWVCLVRTELPVWAALFAAFLLKRMEQNLRRYANYPYLLSTQEKPLEHALKHHEKVSKILQENALPDAIDDAVARFVQTHDVSDLGHNKPKLRKISVTADIPWIMPKLSVDFSQLERIREEARGMTEHLIVESQRDELEEENAGNIAGTGWKDFYSALDETQISCINLLCNSGLCTENAISMEKINELALEFIGDNLIDTAEDTPYIYDEYLSKWREIR